MIAKGDMQMQFPVKTGAPTRQKFACVAIPVFEGKTLDGVAREFDAAHKGLLRKLLKAGDATTDVGRCLLVPQVPGRTTSRLLLVGCGARRDFNAKRYKQVLAASAAALKGLGSDRAISYLPDAAPADVTPYYAARLAVETTTSVFYQFDELKSKRAVKPKLKQLALGFTAASLASEARRGSRPGSAIAGGMALARDLGNRPPNICTPSHLAEQAQTLAKRYTKLRVEILDERDMKRLKMGALLSVTQGAKEAARLIVMRYQGAAASQTPIALCGKGVTFDTGGISLKPPPKMDEMKFDMCGAAGVIGTIAAIAELGAAVNVVGVIPACENMPSDRATRPGDIVTTMSGQTVEILNTDAEGRLILCDAMTYAKRFKPRYLIDVATLTGACVIAIGNVYTGLFSNDDRLADELLAAGRRSLDPAWRLPADEEYGESLKSNFADFANSGVREGGASIAANYLSRFVDGLPWAHLDIAGVAWKANVEKGATGRVVPLLTDFLLNA
ncbi:MAG TPA: leucyl aminopeptidase [Gammaproteobacteria bacterium]|nr:leucyl aminopeptidase [Gammaproteobacteria bacterium]